MHHAEHSGILQRPRQSSSALIDKRHPAPRIHQVLLHVQTRLPKALTDELEATLGEHQADLYISHEADEGSLGAALGRQGNFPAEELLKLIDDAIQVKPEPRYREFAISVTQMRKA